MDHQIFTVSEIASDLKALIEDNFSQVWVTGELGNVKLHGSGHFYFTLKDEVAQLSAAMWRAQVSRLRFRPEDGMQVVVAGRLSFYPPQGKIQLYAEEIQPAGIGALQMAFEALKKKLEAEGLFAEERKRALLLLPRKVGIVTSETGAVIHDLVQNMRRRFPPIDIIFAPAKVQGVGAAEDIAEKIAWINRRADVDVLIVGRGGGSLEDLWAFNEEVVCRAIFASRIPVISAVGHESDFTLADFVADVRASTPTAAAELAVPLRDDLLYTVDAKRQRLLYSWQHYFGGFRERVRYAWGRFRDPREAFRRARDRCRYLEKGLAGAFQSAVERRRRELMHLERRIVHPQTLVLRWKHRLEEANLHLAHRFKSRLSKSNERVLVAATKLRLLSPLAILDRGYAIVFKDGDKRPVKGPEEVKEGEALQVRVAHGKIGAVVK